MKYLLLLSLSSLLSASAMGDVNCNIHRYYCLIVATNPNVEPKFAMELSNALYRYRAPNISVAIAMQESGLRPVTKAVHEFSDGTTTTDYGIFQINEKTAKALHINVTRLQYDIDYQVRQHLRILRKKISVCERLGLAKSRSWSCYHSYTRSYRLAYAEKVERWTID